MVSISRVELLRKKLLKLKFNYESLSKKYPSRADYYDNVLEGIDLAIIEFDTVFGELYTTGGLNEEHKEISDNYIKERDNVRKAKLLQM